MTCASSCNSLGPSSLALFMMLGFKGVTVNIWGALHNSDIFSHVYYYYYGNSWGF